MIKLVKKTQCNIAFTAAFVASVFGAGMAFSADYSKFRNDPRMHSELLGASIAYLIDESCSELGLRKLRLLNKAYSLRKHAVSLGESSSTVMAYVESKTEQDRFRSLAVRK